MNGFPDFGKDLQRPFEVDERCFDCAELYHGCNARPEDPDTRCPDYFQLPGVMPGTTGQVIPASRMGGRKEPRPPVPIAARAQNHVQGKESPVSERPKQARQQSPAGNPGPDGKRLCGCGAILPKRKRCCDTCRAGRRKTTMHRRRNGQRPSVASRSDPDVPSTHAGRPSTPCRSGAHN